MKVRKVRWHGVVRERHWKLQPSSSPSQTTEPRSTTKMNSWGHWPWKPLVLSTHLPPGQELTKIGQQKMAEVECSSSSPTADPSGSLATRQQLTNYRAEAYALLAAAQTLNQKERLSTNTVFLTDCQSILQSLQSPGGEQVFRNMRQELSLLKNKASVTLQWISSHRGVGDNEETDWLSKVGSKLGQSAHPMLYS